MFPMQPPPLRLLPLLALLAACRGAPPAEPAELAPIPYTADEIRAAHPPGTKLVFQVEQTGLPTIHRTMLFARSEDPDATLIEGRTTTPEGQELQPAEQGAATWEELRHHAAFPADGTERSETEVLVPAGRFDCTLYTVGTVEAGAPTVSRYWFAHDKPGPPVLLEIERGGLVILRMTLLEYHKG